MEHLILVGGGGHALSCMAALELNKKIVVAGVVDPDENCLAVKNGVRYLGSDLTLPKSFWFEKNVVISIGHVRSSVQRRETYLKLKSYGTQFPVIVATSAFVSNKSNIHPGTVILHHCLVNHSATVGENCIVNSSSIIEHGASVGDHSHISTNVVVNGDVKIGPNCLIGSGVTLKQGIKIGSNCTIQMGTTVFEDLPSNTELRNAK